MIVPDMHLWKKYINRQYIPFPISITKEKIKRKTIDLHGYNLHNAWIETKNLIEDAYYNDIKFVTIITGNNNNKPSIKTEIYHWLETPNLKKFIIYYEKNQGHVLIKIKNK